MLNKIKKLLLIIVCFLFFVVNVQCQKTSGIKAQNQMILHAVTSYLKTRDGCFQNLENFVKKILKNESKCFGPCMEVTCKSKKIFWW